MDMRVDKNHRLNGVVWTPSLHCDERPKGSEIDLVVVHCVSLPEGRFGTGMTEKLFVGELDTRLDPAFSDLEGLKVSPHLLIDREGSVKQFVSFEKRAWHSGISSWCGRESCNDFSIGIELEGDIGTSFEQAQYDSLRVVLGALFAVYSRLSMEAVVGHNEIAPGRKKDPGRYFDWTSIYENAAAKR